jgi:hypothetical protein
MPSRKVFVQLPYKPEERRHVGWLEVGSRPDEINWACLGHRARACRQGRVAQGERRREKRKGDTRAASPLRGPRRPM